MYTVAVNHIRIFTDIMEKLIKVRGAREHNLKNIDIEKYQPGYSQKQTRGHHGFIRIRQVISGF